MNSGKWLHSMVAGSMLLCVAGSMLLCVAGSKAMAAAYTTVFPITENPISEGGKWIGGKTVGLDWSDVAVASHLAICTVDATHNPTYNDSTAILTGTWGSNQTVSGVVYITNQGAIGYPEIELRLRSSVSAHSCTGYEVLYSMRNDATAYISLVKWLGPYGSFTAVQSGGIEAKGLVVTNGSTIKATMIGTNITVYLNGAVVVTAADSTYTNGNPGFGMDIDSSHINQNGTFGLTSFSATDAAAANVQEVFVPR